MKKLLSIIYRIAIIAVTVYGLYLNFSHSGFFRMIVYFTILSNIAVIAFFVYAIFSDIFSNGEKARKYYILKLSLLVCILVTMFAFEFAVRPYVNFKTGYSSMNIRDTIVHIVVPIMTILDYLFFDEKGNFEFEYITKTMLFPTSYLVFSILYGNLGGTFTAFRQISRYPYIFMDFDTLGNFAIVGCILAACVFVGIATILVFIDKKLVLKQK